MLPGRSMPLLFISATPSTCERVRRDLNLEKFRSQGLYYDLTCNDDTMKKITMLPEKMPDETKQLLTVFYGDSITELDNKTANELLVKSTPKAQALQAQQSLHVCIYEICILFYSHTIHYLKAKTQKKAHFGRTIFTIQLTLWAINIFFFIRF